MLPHETAILAALQGHPDALEALCDATDFKARWTVYETSIRATLQKTLYKTFKPLEALLGKALFQELCYRYAAQHLSTELNLTRYGSQFAEFASIAPFAEALPYLSDFIEFCYLWQQCYVQATGEVLVIESDYPLYDIWARCQPEFKDESIIENWQGPFHYALYYEDAKVKVIALEPEELP